MQYQPRSTNWKVNLPIQTALFSIGNGLHGAALVLYLAQYIGISRQKIGLILALAYLCSVITSLISGKIVDDLGARKIWLISVGIDAIAHISLALIHHSHPAALMISLAAISGSLGNTARIAYTYNSVPESIRRDVQAIVRMTLFAGLGIGALLSGLLIASIPIRMYWVIPLSTGMVYLLNFCYMFSLASYTIRKKDTALKIIWHREKRFLTACCVYAFLRINENLPTVAFPLWALNHTNYAKATASIGLVVNTIMILSLQLAISRMLRKFQIGKSILLSTGNFALSSIIISFTSDHKFEAFCIILIISSVIYSIGQIIFSTLSWDIFAQVTDSRNRGKYQAIWQAISEAALVLFSLIFPYLMKVSSGIYYLAAYFILGGLISVLALYRMRFKV